jgi:thiol:disulfide interchange protein DsbD
LDFLSQLEGLAMNSPGLAVGVSFLGGMLASLTPCSYPMLPITVAFIGGKAHGSRWKGFKLAVFYVLGLALVYASLGAFAALTGRMFGAMTTSPWTYWVVGNICLFFGLAMLGVVGLTPPAFLNRLQVRDLPGHDILSSLLLGGASALVISTCTTPVLAVLLTIVATGQNVVWGFAMLFAFAYGMGSLVIFVGTFTSLLTALPRSGTWMRRVQKGFGLLMIFAAQYYFIKTGELWL